MIPRFLFHNFLFLSLMSVNLIEAQNNGGTTSFNVSVVLDMDSPMGFQRVVGKTIVPKGGVIPMSGKKLKIAVPYTGFTDFVKVDHDTSTNTTIIKGYTIDIFEAVVDSLPYALPYEFVPFEICKGVNTYDDVIYQVYLQKFDAVVRTTTITANRSLYVDFTLPYTDGGVSMLVPIKFDGQKSAWFFSEPLTKELWLTILAFFILAGLVIWVLEHHPGSAFRGPSSQQIGMILCLWFRLSTLVFAHRERLISNLTRFVVMIWIFVFLVLTSTYTASLSTIFTVERLQPAVTSVQDHIENGDYVGYRQGAFMRDMLKGMKFDESKIKSFSSIEDCDNALSKGSQNGGISAYFDVTPYIKGIIAKHCDKYSEIFSRGSPLVGDISRAILNITQGHKMIEIDRKWFGLQASSCSEGKKKSMSSSLSGYNFRGLFIITGTVSVLAFLIYLGKFVYKNWNILTTPAPDNDTFWNRCRALLKIFYAREPPSDEYNLRLRILRQFVEEIVTEAAHAPNVTSAAPSPEVVVAPTKAAAVRMVTGSGDWVKNRYRYRKVQNWLKFVTNHSDSSGSFAIVESTRYLQT